MGSRVKTAKISPSFDLRSKWQLFFNELILVEAQFSSCLRARVCLHLPGRISGQWVTESGDCRVRQIHIPMSPSKNTPPTYTHTHTHAQWFSNAPQQQMSNISAAVYANSFLVSLAHILGDDLATLLCFFFMSKEKVWLTLAAVESLALFFCQLYRTVLFDMFEIIVKILSINTVYICLWYFFIHYYDPLWCNIWYRF